MSRVNHQFRASVTSVAFSLSLSKHMIVALVGVAHGHKRRMDLSRHLSMVHTGWNSEWALRQRGLIYPSDPTRPGISKLTRAGELVLELLREAGLTEKAERAVKETTDAD